MANTSTCPSCFMEVPRGFVACPYCNVFFIMRDRNSGLDFSPVKRVYRRKLEPNLPPSQAHSLELTEEDLARPAGDLRMVIGNKISRALAFGGITHIAGFNTFVRKAATVTIMWQIKWLMGATDGRQHSGPASMRGFIPWFKNWGPITWGLRTVPPWNDVADWPNIDQSGLGYLEKIMAEVCWKKRPK